MKKINKLAAGILAMFLFFALLSNVAQAHYSNNTPAQTCQDHSYQQCSGDYLYWYDSCDNQQDKQLCQNGCSQNACQQEQSYGQLIVSKTVRNLDSENSIWSNSVYAKPSDTVMFMISLQATGNQDAHNVLVKDAFPSNSLIYKNQLVVAGLQNNNYSGDILSGINVPTISAGQTITISYQAQVASSENLNYGSNTLVNGVSVTSAEYGSQQANASVLVTKNPVYGASRVSTGLTNNLLTDSFIIPLAIILFLLWLWKSGLILRIKNNKN